MAITPTLSSRQVSEGVLELILLLYPARILSDGAGHEVIKALQQPFLVVRALRFSGDDGGNGRIVRRRYLPEVDVP